MEGKTVLSKARGWVWRQREALVAQFPQGRQQVLEGVAEQRAVGEHGLREEMICTSFLNSSTSLRFSFRPLTYLRGKKAVG